MRARAIIFRTSMVSLPALTTGTWVALQAPSYKELFFAIGTAYGAVAGFAALVYLRLRKTLGTFTAVAAVCLLSAALFALVALVMPTCPGYVTSERCNSQELGSLTLLGILSPILVFVLIAPFYAAYKILRKAHEFLTVGTAASPSRLSRFKALLKKLFRLQSSKSQTNKAAQEAPIKPGKGRPTPKRPKAKRSNVVRN